MKELAEFERRLKLFEETHDDYLFIGTKDPDDHERIRRRYFYRRKALADFVQTLINGETK